MCLQYASSRWQGSLAWRSWAGGLERQQGGFEILDKWAYTAWSGVEKMGGGGRIVMQESRGAEVGDGDCQKASDTHRR